jgi:hypothetical protein
MVTKEWKDNYNKEWYRKNREARRKQINERKQKLIEWYREYKSTLKCSKCPENHPSCIQFHHLDPKKKDITISEAFKHHGWSKERFLKEVDKCIVVCANCHAKIHYDERLGINVMVA